MYIKSITLENVRGFDKLNFDFSRPGSSLAGWTVFVGGNASGKSTILKALALAILGPDASKQLMGNGSGWVRHNEKRAEAKVEISWDSTVESFKKGGNNPGPTFEAGVRWQLEDQSDIAPVFRAIEKRNQRGTRIQTAERGPWNPNSTGWFSAGYGPMRRLSGSSSESIRYAVGGGVVSRFVTLFREDAALSESEEWLRRNYSRTLEAENPELRELVENAKALLGSELLPHGMKISRLSVDSVFVSDKNGVELPMRDISDGCRSIYATVLDLLHGMFEVYGLKNTFQRESDGHLIVKAPGVVLIDEIEAHLHPSWQRDIPYWLKKHFPNVQFLVTTHSPLVAQAADPNGIFVLPSQSDIDRVPRPLTDEEYEKIRWGKAERTLLGVAFGLNTTRSEWANQQIEKWRRLNSKNRARQKLTDEEKRELNALAEQIPLALGPESEVQ